MEALVLYTNNGIGICDCYIVVDGYYDGIDEEDEDNEVGNESED
jgi:hypothetical protein